MGMNHKGWVSAFVLLGLGLQFNLARAEAESPIPDLDLDATYQEYLPHLKKSETISIQDTQTLAPFWANVSVVWTLDEIQRLGMRNLEWLRTINAARPANQKISLSSKDKTVGYPVETPLRYNPQLISDRMETTLAAMPQVMKEVLLGSSTLSPNIPIDEAEYIQNALQVNRVFSSAVRWKSVAVPYMPWLISAKRRDIRGYYYLNKEENLVQKLQDFRSQPQATQDHLKANLVELCRLQTGALSQCESDFNTDVQDGNVKTYFDRYAAHSRGIYNSFFEMSNLRGDIEWNSSNPNVATIPFVHTEPRIEQFLADNIQDEWKWNGWTLLLNFVPDRFGIPYVVFEPNVTPHVNGIGGDQITMDANSPLTEYEVQWAIRHEFGHVLSFPDCYLEFYDTAEEVVVSYQLDITDLMCSRRGQLKERHFTQMRDAYQK